jgi:hypothetical protein
MPAGKPAANQVPLAQQTDTAKEAPVAVAAPVLAMGDTLTVVSGQIGGAWMVEDESGTVYTATPVE